MGSTPVPEFGPVFRGPVRLRFDTRRDAWDSAAVRTDGRDLFSLAHLLAPALPSRTTQRDHACAHVGTSEKVRIVTVTSAALASGSLPFCTRYAASFPASYIYPFFSAHLETVS